MYSRSPRYSLNKKKRLFKRSRQRSNSPPHSRYYKKTRFRKSRQQRSRSPSHSRYYKKIRRRSNSPKRQKQINYRLLLDKHELIRQIKRRKHIRKLGFFICCKYIHHDLSKLIIQMI